MDRSPSSPRMSTSPSEMLLRSTLLRDEMATRRRSRRRGSSAPYSDDDDDDDDDEHIISPSSLSTSSRSQSGGSIQQKQRARSHVRSPSYPPVPLTPHEQVLRARLEHVLDAYRDREQEESVDIHQRPRRKRASVSASRSHHSGGAFGWLWRDHSSDEEDDPSPPPIPSPQRPVAATSVAVARAPSPSPPRVRSFSSRTASYSPRHAWSADSVPISQITPRSSTPPPGPKWGEGERAKIPDFKRRPTQLDLPSMRPETGLPTSPHHIPPCNIISSSAQPPTRFCARSAAQTVKNMDGYVSFSAIEGLGVPETDTDDNSSEEGKDKAGWKGKWLTSWKP